MLGIEGVCLPEVVCVGTGTDLAQSATGDRDAVLRGDGRVDRSKSTRGLSSSDDRMDGTASFPQHKINKSERRRLRGYSSVNSQNEGDSATTSSPVPDGHRVWGMGGKDRTVQRTVARRSWCD